ncbi:oligosaccharide flippase family protein [Novosphingobium sp. FSY-8]|uniref:Oligosaccharide flippase family protein n=1 Tax=Novosphingobium ovatum TaxID=1908523 RepID=A0ABW9XG63_9SPHN|nr:lipopolysaccharide biosynthesis protein [Novosphingobium ovatum]NBC37463.1 oligosaccharide flippase family protein [Novosphingobium ovatum]
MTEAIPLPQTPPPAADRGSERDIAALAKGGRTNFFGFLLRLAARLPFLFIAGRLYGADALGRFASALVVIELAAQLCTLGQKRGIAQRLSEDDRDAAHIIADALVLTLLIAVPVSLGLYLFPYPMFPSDEFTALDRLLVLAIFPIALTDIALAALAYRFDVGATVRARSVVEPWTLSIAAGVFFAAGSIGWTTVGDSGLSLSFIASIFAAAVAALVPLWRSYGLPRRWTPHPLRIGRLALDNMPLAVADAVEWGTRRIDIAILGQFATTTSVGVYYVAQQVASLPQKLKTSFEPILGPVITRNLKEGKLAAIARQVSQVGFWITAAQAGIALALGIPGDGVLGLVGPQFTGGILALAFLLGAEVGAATAVVSEAALVYTAPMRNLWVSIATIALQAVLTFAGMLIAGGFGFNEMDQAASAAGALMVTLSIASFVKSRLLAWQLKQPVNTWRWSLLLAAAVASAVGWVVMQFPAEWQRVGLGVPLILAVYCLVIWRFGFGPEDRVLFRKQPKAESQA